jgi:hypothetical protein
MKASYLLTGQSEKLKAGGFFCEFLVQNFGPGIRPFFFNNHFFLAILDSLLLFTFTHFKRKKKLMQGTLNFTETCIKKIYHDVLPVR